MMLELFRNKIVKNNFFIKNAKILKFPPSPPCPRVHCQHNFFDAIEGAARNQQGKEKARTLFLEKTKRKKPHATFFVLVSDNLLYFVKAYAAYEKATIAVIAPPPPHPTPDHFEKGGPPGPHSFKVKRASFLISLTPPLFSRKKGGRIKLPHQFFNFFPPFVLYEGKSSAVVSQTLVFLFCAIAAAI